jgi:hypothetical protein
MNRYSEKHLHIVSFDVPYPPNYGGVIDVFYKIRALHDAGVNITLHCFEYGRGKPSEPEALCRKIHYYPRKTGLLNHFSLLPYIVSSRRNKELLTNLMADDAPILFEGLHTCSLLSHPALKNRLKIYRESNIEHHYYWHLYRATRRLKEKAFYFTESVKLRLFQKILKHADRMYVVSEADTEYLRKHFPHHSVEYLPSFHGNTTVRGNPGKGTYALYHGKLSVAENNLAADFLIRQVFSNIEHRLVIAGMDPPESMTLLARRYPNVEVIPNPDAQKMDKLVSEAHVNILITFQPTGLKLKLLNTLYQGRFCIVNSGMLAGTRLSSLCEVADGADALRRKTNEIFSFTFSENEIAKRRQILDEQYSDAANLKKLLSGIFNE